MTDVNPDGTVADEKTPKKVVQWPDDFKSAEDFLRYVREEVSLDESADRENRDAGMDDSRFFAGDQWTADAKRKRKKKPVITENFLPAFVAQVLGNRRLNEAQIKVIPDHGGKKPIAALREGLIRNIQKNATAETAYNGGLQNGVVCGVGNFRTSLKYAYDDVFEQDITIDPLPNAFSVVWDRMSIEPTGRDADHVTVSDPIPRKSFERQYPDAKSGEVMWQDQEAVAGGWVTPDTVRVAGFWRVRTRKRTLAMYQDGTVHDITEQGLQAVATLIAQYDDGSPIMRECDCKYAEHYLLTATDLLDGPYTLPIDRVPIFRVMGWEHYEGEKRHRWGLIRFLKDPQRLHNYWRSIIAEKLQASPKASWVARAGAVQGRELEWRNSHQSDDPLLIANDEAAELPVRVPPVQIEAALIQESETTKQVIKDISNIHEASLGQQSNEVSGKAIVARQRVGELGSVIYQDNLNLAIGECGRVINQLIPHVYNSKREVTILGPDDKAVLQVINDPTNPDSDLTLGKYAVSVTTGPSYVTKRIEAQEAMLALFNAAPQLLPQGFDLVIKNMDWPGADELAKRYRPPGTTPPDEMSPEEQQQAVAQAQAEQVKTQLAMAMAKAQLDEAQAKVEEIQARTALLQAQVAAVPMKTALDHDKLKIDAAKADTEARSTQLNDHLAAIETAHAGDEASDNQGD